jgi:hypothetical protein
MRLIISLPKVWRALLLLFASLAVTALAGFHLYRTPAASGEAVRITDILILATGSYAQLCLPGT